MQTKKVYNQDVINNLKAEIGKLKDHKTQELTLDKIFVHAKKDITELIELNCTAHEIASIFNKAGVRVGVGRIKKLYFISAAKRNSKRINSNKQVEKE